MLIATLCLRLTDAARGDDDARTRVSAFCIIFLSFSIDHVDFSLVHRHACTGGFHSRPRCFAFIRLLGMDAFEFLSSLGHRAPYLCHMISCAARSECTYSESDSVRHHILFQNASCACTISSCSFTMCSANSYRSRAGTTTTTRASHPVQHTVMLTAHDSVHHTCSNVNLIRIEISTVKRACTHDLISLQLLCVQCYLVKAAPCDVVHHVILIR